MKKVKQGTIGRVIRVGDLICPPFVTVEVGEDGVNSYKPYAIVEQKEGEPEEQEQAVAFIDIESGIVTLEPLQAIISNPDMKGKQAFPDQAMNIEQDPVKAWSDDLTPAIEKAAKPAFTSYAVRRSLAVKLTPCEIAAKADQAMTLEREVQEAEAEKKQSATDFADRIKDLKAQIRRNVEAHHTGEENRSVDCRQIFDLKSGKTWFEFQNRKHEERRMSDYEIRETNNTLFGDAQIEGALQAPEIDVAPDSPVRVKTSEELAAEVGERAREMAEKKEKKEAAKIRKSGKVSVQKAQV